MEVRLEKEYTNKCDVFTLGVLLWYLISKNEKYRGKLLSNIDKENESHAIPLEPHYS